MNVLSQLQAALADRYEIEREVGAGGMATVYLARDVRHNRRVALKVLKPELGLVLGPERFLSEIETTASLQHPHLLPLFDSGGVDGLLFYVMPYVEGETLRQRIERERQLPVDEAIRIAVAVASALDYAHRRGVIHRDLKPENILLHEGQPLVTDFGIALAVSNAGGARITQTGLSLGTPQYMSPEQATGDRALDARSDIYSLGAVLYEMLTGDPPHMAGTTQAIIAKVLTERPPSVRALRETVPEHVDLAIQKALSKLAADRFASAGEFAESLTGARRIVPAKSAAVDAVPAPREPRPAGRLMWLGWVVSVAALAALWIRPDPARQTARFAVTLPDSLQLGPVLLMTPDGSKLIFGGRLGAQAGLFVRRLDDVTPEFIRGTEGATWATLSPRGDWILFNRGAGLAKTPITGGTAQQVADSAFEGTWSERGEIVFESQRNPGALSRISADGGSETVLVSPDSARRYVRYVAPDILPGGKAALILIGKGTRGTAGSQLNWAPGIVTIPEGTVTELPVDAQAVRYSPSGHVLFSRTDGVVLAAPFSVSGLRLLGPAVPVIDEPVGFTSDGAQLAVAANGTLAYLSSPAAGARALVAVDWKGAVRVVTPERERFSFPRLSPDGRRIAVSIGTRSGSDVWTYDIASRTLTRLTHDGTSGRPEWSPDGRRIAYLSRDSVGSVIKWQPWDASGVAEVLSRPRPGVMEVSLGARYAAFRVGGATGGGDRDVWIAPADSLGAPRPFLATPVWEGHPRVSPNGQLLAYTSEENGRDEVYVRPLPGPGGRVQVSAGGGEHPVWSADGREIFHRGPRHVMSASIAQAPELAVTRRDTLFEDVYARDPDHQYYDVFPGGRELLMVREGERGESTLMIVLNWSEELRRRVRGR